VALQDGPTNVLVDGVPLIGTAADGCEIRTATVDGWDGATGTTLALTQKTRRSGAWTGRAYAVARHVVLDGTLWAPTPTALQDGIDRLNATLPRSPVVLTVRDFGGRERWATVTREDDIVVTRKSPTHAVWSAQVASDDWRKFGATRSNSTALPSTSGGLTLPTAVPFAINASSVSGEVVINNPGNASGPVTVRFDGPVVGPVVSHVESGRRVSLASSYSAGAGEFLLVDNERHVVLANGLASRGPFLRSRQWLSLLPGRNTFAFSAATFDAAALMTVTAVEAWE
jgi:hypothetical protein